MTKKNTNDKLATVPTIDLAQQSAEMSDLIAENLGPAGLDVSDLDTVKVPSGGARSWQIPGEDDDSKDIVGVILGWRDRRAYWSRGMDEGNGNSPPDCSSPDAITGSGSPGGACKTCPMAKWGSGKGNSQACKAMRAVYIRRPGAVLPLVVMAPATSITQVRKYFVRLLSRRLGFWQVETRLTLEQTQSRDGITYSRIVLDVVSELNEEDRLEANSMMRSLASAIEAAPSEEPASQPAAAAAATTAAPNELSDAELATELNRVKTALDDETKAAFADENGQRFNALLDEHKSRGGQSGEMPF